MTDIMDDLEQIADEITSTEDRVAQLKHDRDLLVASARRQGHRYGEIAQRARMSVSWVTSALSRTGSITPRSERVQVQT